MVESSLAATLTRPGPKRLLAIDGGGIRGVIALEILARIEQEFCPEGSNRRLADVFDYIAGTSTGAIIAAGLALGKSVAELRAFYVENGAAMFDRASLWRRHRYLYDDDQLREKLQSIIGEETTLGSKTLKTLLLMVMRNASTDSPWALTNNPYAKYNHPEHPGCNLKLPLWQLTRASTAAPVYFPPEQIEISSSKGGSSDFLFVDGGMTPYNNPAFLCFLMATVQAYWPNINRPEISSTEPTWPAKTGAENMLLVSVGTGFSAKANENLRPDDLNIAYNATAVPSALMLGAQVEQDMLCRVFGDCRSGDPLDRQLGDLSGTQGEGAVPEKLFSYVRYNADLSAEGLAKLGLEHVKPERVQDLAGVHAIDEMQVVGTAVAKEIETRHFEEFLD